MSERKQQILQQAIQIIAREGYGKLTMRALAKASGMKLGALQYHFATREVLLQALTDAIAEDYAASLAQLEAENDALTIRDVVQWYLQDSGGARLESDWLWPQLWAMGRVEPQMRALLDGIASRLIELLERYLTEAGSTNARAEALAIVSLAEGSTLFVGTDTPWEADADQLVETVLEIIDNKYGGRYEQHRATG